MAKTPSKRGSGRGKTGAGDGKPATKRDGPKKSTGKKATGKKLPGWMPDAAAGGKPPRHDKQAAAKPAAGKPQACGPGGIHDPHAARAAARSDNSSEAPRVGQPCFCTCISRCSPCI